MELNSTRYYYVVLKYQVEMKENNLFVQVGFAIESFFFTATYWIVYSEATCLHKGSSENHKMKKVIKSMLKISSIKHN